VSDRRLAREVAVQALYEMDQTDTAWPRPLAENALRRNASDAARAYAERLLRTVDTKREAIRATLAAAIDNWSLERVAMVDRCVLEIATAEILYFEDVAVATIIDEAVAVVRKFSTDESGAFVNGVLDRVARARAAGGPGSA
jgi:N utilization substance protein B